MRALHTIEQHHLTRSHRAWLALVKAWRSEYGT